MVSINRRALLSGTTGAALTALSGIRPAFAEDTPGVTATEIRIGSTTSLSGPVSALGVQARCQEAYFKMLNEQGGIAGRQIKYIYYDDAFNPAKTVEQVRRLIESDNVAFLFNMLGTAPNSAVVKYINAAKVPHARPVPKIWSMPTDEVVTTDFMGCDDTTNRHELRGLGRVCDTDDAMVGQALQTYPSLKWFAIRNACIPQMANQYKDIAALDQAAAAVYARYGAITTAASVIACWAVIDAIANP